MMWIFANLTNMQTLPPRSLMHYRRNVLLEHQYHVVDHVNVAAVGCHTQSIMSSLVQPHSCSNWPTSTGQRPSRRRSRGCWPALSRRQLERETPPPRGPLCSVLVSKEWNPVQINWGVNMINNKVVHINGAIPNPMQWCFEFLHLNTLCGCKHTSFLTLSIGQVNNFRPQMIVFINPRLIKISVFFLFRCEHCHLSGGEQESPAGHHCPRCGSNWGMHAVTLNINVQDLFITSHLWQWCLNFFTWILHVDQNIRAF